MENLFEVQAELRTDEGKGASRRLRHAGMVQLLCMVVVMRQYQSP